jgi:hypothetical protein
MNLKVKSVVVTLSFDDYDDREGRKRPELIKDGDN